jgi:hypothetical protein
MPTRLYLPKTRMLRTPSTTSSAVTYLFLRTAVDEAIDVGLTAQRSMEGECNEYGP